jgi:hypothetical protein
VPLNPARRTSNALTAFAAVCAMGSAVSAGPVTFTDRLVSASAPQADGVAAGDVDGDGDMDVVAGEYAISSITWYENNGASPPAWTKRIVGAADGAINVAVADVDGDGDGDVFSANLNDEGINFYENLGGTPPAWTRRALGDDGGAWGVDAADVDGDGDLDAIGGLMNNTCGPPLCVGVKWYENDGDSPPGFVPRAVAQGPVGALSVHAADLDGDGDTDILSVDNGSNRVLWYESDGTRPPVWTQRVVIPVALDPWGVFAADVDRDGDLDVLTSSIGDDRLVWHENDGARPPAWTPHPLPTTIDGPISVSAADLDADGDVDIICGANDTNMAWYENDGAAAPGFVGHRIGNCVSPLAIDAARVDGDADVDVLCAANFVPGRVHFFDNEADYLESDGDGVEDELDCAPLDAAVFAVPGEVRGLRFATGMELVWTTEAPRAGAGTIYDVLEGRLDGLPVGSADEVCRGRGTTGTTFIADAEVPAGTGSYYVVRGATSCGAGTWGFASSGLERTSTTCP